MDIQKLEPLKTIINITTDKKLTILFFLSNELQEKLKDYELIDEKFYLNDFICLIKKNNLENIYNGKIICTNENNNEITIKKNSHNITLNTDLYYVFVKRNLSKNNDRQFYKSLLEKL